MGPRLALQFEIHPSSGVPIYRQVMDQLRSLIASGRLVPGDLVPSVRQMAEELQINLMTVSKAYAKLEADGLLERDRGIGMRVEAAQSPSSRAERLQQLRPHVEQITTLAWQLKLTEAEVLHLVKTSLRSLENKEPS